MKGATGTVWDRVITVYYLATPIFAVVDFAAHWPVRVAGLATPGWRWAYYAALMVLGLLCRAWPRWAPVVGMAESAANLLLLLLSILLPIWSLPDQVLAGGAVTGVAGGPQIANLALAGSMAIVSFKRNEAAFQERLGRRG